MIKTQAFNEFEIIWSDPKRTKATFYFYTNKDTNKLHIDNECMSKDYIKKVLCEMVDTAILDDVPWEENE